MLAKILTKLSPSRYPLWSESFPEQLINVDPEYKDLHEGCSFKASWHMDKTVLFLMYRTFHNDESKLISDDDVVVCYE